MPVKELWDESSQWELIKLWEKSWQAQGWETCILQEHHAREHPRFYFFNEMFRSKVSAFGEEFNTACFMRWFAAYVVGSTENKPLMLCDYDVCNYYFPPREPKSGKMEIICDGPKIFLGTVLGTPQHFLDMAELFAAHVLDEHDWSLIYNQVHTDDLRLVERMFDGTKEKPEWLVRSPGCALFPAPGWKTAPMTHYAYAMRAAGFWPKYKFIPDLRPVSYA